MKKLPIEEVITLDADYDPKHPSRWDMEAGGYENLLSSLGVEILVSKSAGDYQGDTFIVLRDKETGQYGTYVFGWGSCSGCDAYEGCNSIAEFSQLRDDMERGIKWHDSLSALKAYVQGDEFESWREDDPPVGEFREAVKALE